MGIRECKIFIIFVTFLLNACTTSLHGSFVTASYSGGVEQQDAVELGPVEGRSCQTGVLYVFPRGEAPTTDEAISNAKSVREDISFIADISIDDETHWGIGYSVKCVVVRAAAYR